MEPEELRHPDKVFEHTKSQTEVTNARGLPDEVL